MRYSPISRRVCIGIGISFIYARERPSFLITLLINSSSLLSSISKLLSFSLIAILFFIEKMAVISVFSEPPLITLVSARSPSINPKAPSRIDFPAPVSPVKTVMPFSKSRHSLFIMARSLIIS